MNDQDFPARISVSRIEVERVRFDTQLLQHSQIEGTDYQRGTLAGWEIRAYVLVKYAYRCAYCGKTDCPFELDHIRPRSRGGSNSVNHLCLACHSCNQAKQPLKDAAAVNSTRFKLVETLRVCGLPIDTWTGGRTSWNRMRFGIEKTHAFDALCVGQVAAISAGGLKTLLITANGRGKHCRANWDRYGFPAGYLMRQKRVRGFQTGDRVRAVVPEPLKTAGTHLGRVRVRKSGSFRVGSADGIAAAYCHMVQRADGYEYKLA